MFRHLLVATLRNLARSKLYTAINLVGLTLGFAAALLIGIFLFYFFSANQFLPDHERIYSIRVAPIEALDRDRPLPSDVAEWIAADLPEVEAVARWTGWTPLVRNSDFELRSLVSWADPNFFEVLKYRALSGDLERALERPDAVVISRSTAERFFGRIDVVGEPIVLDGEHTMHVAAVIEDPPPNTSFSVNIVASSRAAFSPFAREDANQVNDFSKKPWIADTIVRLAAGTIPRDFSDRLQDMLDRHAHMADVGQKASEAYRLLATNIGRAMIPPLGILTAFAGMGILIVGLACVNFVNLMTARASNRAVEIGIRKTTGANRRHLMVQFLGESLLLSFLALALAVVVVEMTLPYVNAFFATADMRFFLRLDYLLHSVMLGAVVATTAAIGLLAGVYPSLVLSAFRPVSVLRGGPLATSGSGALRRSLVTLQFASLIGLIVATIVFSRQTQFAMNESLRFDADQVVVVGACPDAFRQRVAGIPGVRSVACSQGMPVLGCCGRSSDVKRPDGTIVPLAYAAVDSGYLELYGIKPIAGRFFSDDHGDASAAEDARSRQEPIIINETAVHRLGYRTPEEAIGRAIVWNRASTANGEITPSRDAIVIGVASDFGSSTDLLRATAFHANRHDLTTLNVKLSGQDIPETMAAMDRLWKEVGEDRLFERAFVDDLVQRKYYALIVLSQFFAAFTFMALTIACLGLFGLAVFTAERRTKEIGVRKAMGAGATNILSLITWAFAKPVLWANLLAWPAAYYVMDRWLQGFAYHIPLTPWIFLAAGAIAFAIALLTVSAHAIFAARAKPVAALRYE